MAIPEGLLELENRAIGQAGEPTLGRALELAKDEWNRGSRDRELRLHLLFLSWYCNLEPPHLTGYDRSTFPDEDLSQLFSDVYETFADTIWDDAECLFVVGLMAQLTPYLLGGNETEWEARGGDYRVRYRQLEPDGLSPSHFDRRGAYGDYFGDQVQVEGGF